MNLKSLVKLMANPRVDDVENEGCDEGRFFVHLNSEWVFDVVDQTHSATFGNFKDATAAVKSAKPSGGAA